MSAGVRNILIEQGADFIRNYQMIRKDTGAPLDLTGATFAAKIRKTFDAVASIIDFTIAAVDLSVGTFTVSLTAAQTAGLALPSYNVAPQNVTREGGLGTWDLEYTLGGIVVRAIQGTVTLSQEDTK